MGGGLGWNGKKKLNCVTWIPSQSEQSGEVKKKNKQEERNTKEDDFNRSSASQWTEQELNKTIIWLLIWALAQHWRAAFVWD